jgi:hypothetical protein
MHFTIDDPPLNRLVLAIFTHQQTYPGSSSYERNFGLEKAMRDLRRFADEALLRSESEPVLPTAAQLRAELGDLRADQPEAPERNLMYLTILEALSGLTPTTALAVIARFYRLPFVVTEPDLPPSAMS